MAWWLLWLAATSAVEVRVEPLSAVPFEPQSARVTVTNDRAVARSVQVRFQVKPPADSVWQDTVGLLLPASGEAAATIRYELFVPGSNQVEVTVVEAGLSIAAWRGVVEVSGVDDAPLLFPNYYRQSLTRLDRGQVTRQPAPAGGLVLPRPAVAPLYAVDEHNRITAQGRPWFPLGIYTTPATAARAAELAEAGFDLVHLYAVPSTALRRILDFLHGQGLRAWIPLAWHDATTSQAQEQARELVEAAGSHPGLALWETYDEPAWGGRPAWRLREGYRLLRALDPQRPIWTNHAPRNRIPTLAWYNQATDIAGCDVYPVPMPQTQSDLPNKTLGVVGDETAKSIATVHGEKPVFMVLQGFAWKALSDRADPTAVYPTFDESRFMAYDAIVAGAKGILYWGTDYTPTPSRFWSDLKSLVSELRAVRPLLEAVPVTDGSAVRCLAGEEVGLSHRRVNGHDHLMLVNRGEREQRARLAAPTGRAWRALFGDPAPVVRGTELELMLPPWGVRVLTTDPEFNPSRKRYDEEAAQARPPRPLVLEAGNAIPNASFEGDDNGDGVPDGWHIRFPFSAARDTAVRQQGEASFRFESETAGFAPLAVLNEVKVRPGARYRLSGQVRSDTAGVKARIYAEWVTEGVFHSHVVPWAEPSSAWSPLQIEFTAAPNPAGRLYVVVQIKDQGRVWFDSLKLEEVTP